MYLKYNDFKNYPHTFTEVLILLVEIILKIINLHKHLTFKVQDAKVCTIQRGIRSHYLYFWCSEKV